MFDHLWAVATVLAAAGQTARNALQRGLIERVGTLGATHVRFLYGLPFAVLFLAAVTAGTGLRPPVPTLAFWGWTALGGLAQIAATALLLAAMRERSFIVTVAYSKTEPVQVAIVGLVALGEHLSALTAFAVIVGTAGVLLMSWPRRDRLGTGGGAWRPAVLGAASGSMFAVSAVGFKGGILAIGTQSFLVNASATLVAGLLIQTVVLSAWLALADRRALVAVFRAWRVSIVAGFMGAFASQMWFIGFALEQVARVRTLGLIEMVFAWVVSRRVMRQPTSGREAVGIILIALAALVMVNA